MNPKSDLTPEAVLEKLNGSSITFGESKKQWHVNSAVARTEGGAHIKILLGKGLRGKKYKTFCLTDRTFVLKYLEADYDFVYDGIWHLFFEGQAIKIYPRTYGALFISYLTSQPFSVIFE